MRTVTRVREVCLLLLPNISQALSRSPKFALLSEEVRKLLSCTIYEPKAKPDPSRVWRLHPKLRWQLVERQRKLSTCFIEHGYIPSSRSTLRYDWLGMALFLISTAVMLEVHSPSGALELEKDFA
jgi:hypothetical protein